MKLNSRLTNFVNVTLFSRRIKESFPMITGLSTWVFSRGRYSRPALFKLPRLSPRSRLYPIPLGDHCVSARLGVLACAIVVTLGNSQLGIAVRLDAV